jgi:hypothetical protein
MSCISTYCTNLSTYLNTSRKHFVVFGTGRDCLALPIGTTIRIFNAARLFWLHSAHQSHVRRHISPVQYILQSPSPHCLSSASQLMNLSLLRCLCLSLSVSAVAVLDLSRSTVYLALYLSQSPHICLHLSVCLSSGYTVFQFSLTLSNLGCVCLILTTL